MGRRLPHLPRVAWLAPVALLAAFLLPGGAGAEFAQPGTFEGTVTITPGGAPVDEAKICGIGMVGGEPLTECVESRSNGSYVLQGLPEGEYRIRFSKGASGKNLVPEYYKNVANQSAAKAFWLNEGQLYENINAQLQVQGKGGKPPRGAKGGKGH